MIQGYYGNTITTKRLTTTLNTIKETWVDKLSATSCRIEVLNPNDIKMWIGNVDILKEDRVVDSTTSKIYIVNDVIPFYTNAGQTTPHHNECILELFEEP